jgi:hypothetical protein
MAPAPTHLSIVAVAGSAALIGWRLYVRVRRLMGRQRFSRFRAWLSAVAFAVVVLALLAGSLGHPGRALAELTGVGLGVALAEYGLRATRFEVTPGALFYTPSAHIGIVLSVLLAARIGIGLVQVYVASAAFSEPPVALVHSPLTLFVVGTLAGYYARYAMGLLRWSHAAKCVTQ